MPSHVPVYTHVCILVYIYTCVSRLITLSTVISFSLLPSSPWPQIGIINTSEGAKIYLMPTCVISHELGKHKFVFVVSYHLVFVNNVGITHANHPQMLHGVFVKKIHRESML